MNIRRHHVLCHSSPLSLCLTKQQDWTNWRQISTSPRFTMEFTKMPTAKIGGFSAKPVGGFGGS